MNAVLFFKKSTKTTFALEVATITDTPLLEEHSDIFSVVDSMLSLFFARPLFYSLFPIICSFF